MKIRQIKNLLAQYDRDPRRGFFRKIFDRSEVKKLRVLIRDTHEEEEINFDAFKNSGMITDNYLAKNSLSVEMIFNVWKQSDSKSTEVEADIQLTDFFTEKTTTATDQRDEKKRDTKDTRKESKEKTKEEKNIPYKNKETFLNRTPIHKIDDNDLIVLDGYAFDVTELKDCADRNVAKFYINPHEQTDAKGKPYFVEFSAEAKDKLRKHPILATYAKKLDKQFSEQSKVVTDELLDKLQILLNTYLKIGCEDEKGGKKSTFSYTEKDLEKCDIAKGIFMEYLSTLSEAQRNALNDYIIRLPTPNGGTQNQRMGDVLTGGIIRCIITEQSYEWQFMKDHRPKTVIPDEIANHAQNRLPHGMDIIDIDIAPLLIAQRQLAALGAVGRDLFNLTDRISQFTNQSQAPSFNFREYASRASASTPASGPFQSSTGESFFSRLFQTFHRPRDPVTGLDLSEDVQMQAAIQASLQVERSGHLSASEEEQMRAAIDASLQDQKNGSLSRQTDSKESKVGEESKDSKDSKREAKEREVKDTSQTRIPGLTGSERRMLESIVSLSAMFSSFSSLTPEEREIQRAINLSLQQQVVQNPGHRHPTGSSPSPLSLTLSSRADSKQERKESKTNPESKDSKRSDPTTQTATVTAVSDAPSEPIVPDRSTHTSSVTSQSLSVFTNGVDGRAVSSTQAVPSSSDADEIIEFLFGPSGQHR